MMSLMSAILENAGKPERRTVRLPMFLAGWAIVSIAVILAIVIGATLANWF